MLKKELESEIDQRLKNKIQKQQKEVHKLREGIEKLKNDNDEVILSASPRSLNFNIFSYTKTQTRN